VGSFVAIADTGVSGPSALEIVGVLTADQMREVGREMQIDPRVLAVDATDTTQLLSSKMTMGHEVGYEFGTIDEDDDEEVDVDGI
jgi:hypothetical protein